MSAQPGWVVTFVVATVLAGTPGCDLSRIEANEVDRERIENMRSDPVFRHTVADQVREASAGRRRDDNWDNVYTGYVDLWQVGPAPEPTAAGFQELSTRVVTDLRDGGWTINRSQCEVEVSDGTIAFAWQAHGYREHDGVTYRFWADAVFPLRHDEAWPAELRVVMFAPLHTHTTLGVTPSTTVPAGESCLELVVPPIPDDAQTAHYEVVSNGAPGNNWLGPDS